MLNLGFYKYFILVSLILFGGNNSSAEISPYKPVNELTLADKAPGQSWNQFMEAFDDPRATNDNIAFMNKETQRSRENLSTWISKTDSILRKLHDHETLIQSEHLNQNEKIELIWRGGERGTDLVINTPSKESILISSNQFHFDFPFNFTGFILSPDKKFVALKAIVTADVWFFDFYFVELKTGKFKKISFINDWENEYAWIGTHLFYATSGSSGLVIDALNPEAAEILPAGSYYRGHYPDLLKGINDGKAIFVSGEINQSKLELPSYCDNSPPDDFLRIDPSKVVVICSKKYLPRSEDSATFAVFEYDLTSGSGELKPTLKYKAKGVFSKAVLVDSLLIIGHKYGHKQSLLVIDTSYRIIEDIELPSHLTMTSVLSQEKNKSILIHCQSVASSHIELIFEYRTKEWLLTPDLKKDLTYKGITFINETIEVPARDGVKIPVRLVYRADQKPSKDSPALIEVYGAGPEIKLYPRYDSTLLEMFVQKGGIYIAPAIRGAAAYGKNWGSDDPTEPPSDLGTTDLVDIADWMAKNGYANKNKIISIGLSYGGIKVAEAGLLSPSSFGLIIPGENSFQRARQGNYFKYSSGESDAPLGIPNFFFMTGMIDRLGINNVKMYHKLLMMGATHDQVQGAFFPLGGHWVTRVPYQGVVAIDALSVQWGKIWQFLHW